VSFGALSGYAMVESVSTADVMCDGTIDLTLDRGEVHHRMMRAAHPELRFDPNNGVLLCAICHVRAQCHEIEV
jgi:hypothetical protein